MVGVAFRHQSFDHFGHVVDVVCGAHHRFRGFDIQQAAIHLKGFDKLFGVGPQFESRLLSVADGLVIDVGVVHDVLQPETFVFQIPAKDVQRDEGAEVAEMGIFVDGRPAGVHADLTCLEGRERFFPGR